MLDVAIIITHYKQEKYLLTLLEYLLKHNWMDCKEVIVIDDASLSLRDIDVIKKKYPNIQVCSNEKNRGPSFSRNHGVSLSKAKYIQFLDADDWIDKNKIKFQYEEALKNDAPSFVCSPWSRVTFESTFTDYTTISIDIPNISNPGLINIMANFFPLMSGLILKKDFLLIGGFEEDMRLIEDVNLAIRLFNLKENFLVVKSEPLFFYRVNNPKSLSNSNDIQFNEAMLKNYRISFKLLETRYNDKEIARYRDENFAVLWHIYLSASILKSEKLLNECILEINKANRPFFLIKKHGKTFLLSKLLGLRLTSKILAFKS